MNEKILEETLKNLEENSRILHERIKNIGSGDEMLPAYVRVIEIELERLNKICEELGNK